MRLSELYVMQYLVQSTESARDPLCWHELERGGYWTELSGVRVEVHENHGPTCGLLYITFSNGLEEVTISEPRSGRLFGSRYDNEDQRSLAESMRLLGRRITQQCTRRRIHSIEHSDELQQKIFQRLVFGAALNGGND